MKNNHKIKPILLALVFVLLLVSAYYAKNSVLTAKKTCSDQSLAALIEQSKKNINAPSFVVSYWPAETEQTTLNCYILTTSKLMPRRGVGIQLETLDIAEYEITREGSNFLKPFKDRVRLYVDGETVSDVSKMTWDNIVGVIAIKDGIQYPTGMSSGYEISWTPILLPGKHTAKVEIQTKSGEVFEFEWYFTITY